MAADYAASVQGVALRVCKLDATGAPLVGTKSAYFTKAFTKFSFTPEYKEGDEIEVVQADGSTCVYYKLPDTLKKVNVELAICKPQPELYEMLAGGTVLGAPAPATVTNKALTSNVATLTTSAAHTFIVGQQIVVALSPADPIFDGTFTITAVTSTSISYAKTNANVTSTAAGGTITAAAPDPVGWATPTIGAEATPNGVGIEVWSRAIVAGKPAGTNPYWRWVLPYGKTKMDGERALENGELANVFSGEFLDNAAWGDGPLNDWPYATVSSALQYARAASFPSVSEGYVAVT